MRLKPYSKNIIKSALLLSTVFLSLSCCPIEETYKEKDIPLHIKEICKNDYNLDVVVRKEGDTLWIYIPLTKLLHDKFGIEKDKLFTDEVREKLINIMTGIGRVILSADRAPSFYVLVASDVELGIDYTIIGYALDLKKSYAGFIPSVESDRRYVIRFAHVPEAVNDKEGAHLKVFDVRMEEFLAEQIMQRIGMRFRSEEFDGNFKIEELEGGYEDGVFIFRYNIKEIIPTNKPIDINKEVLKIAAYCLHTYEFEDYIAVRLIDLFNGGETVMGRDALRDSFREF